MACTQGHQECIGPQCTKANAPNRPLIGKAREWAEIMGRFRELAITHWGKNRTEGPNSYVLSFYDGKDASNFVREARAVLEQHPVYSYKITMGIENYTLWTCKIRVKRLKP